MNRLIFRNLTQKSDQVWKLVKILVSVENLWKSWCVVEIRQNRATNRTHVKVIAAGVCNLSFLPNVPHLHFCYYAIMHLHLMHKYASLPNVHFVGGVKSKPEKRKTISKCQNVGFRNVHNPVSNMCPMQTVCDENLYFYLCLHQCIILHQYIQHLNEHQVFINFVHIYDKCTDISIYKSIYWYKHHHAMASQDHPRCFDLASLLCSAIQFMSLGQWYRLLMTKPPWILGGLLAAHRARVLDSINLSQNSNKNAKF